MSSNVADARKPLPPDTAKPAVVRGDYKLADTVRVGDWVTHKFDVKGRRSPHVSTHHVDDLNECPWCQELLKADDRQKTLDAAEQHGA